MYKAIATALLCSALLACGSSSSTPAAGSTEEGDTGTPVPLADSPCANFADAPWCQTSLDPQARASRLLAELSDAEKASLLAGELRSGEAEGFTPGIERLGIPSLEFSDGPPRSHPRYLEWHSPGNQCCRQLQSRYRRRAGRLGC